MKQVGDGSIIARFGATPVLQQPDDVVCPHFLELKWATGCHYDCAWCYLKGTFRLRHMLVWSWFIPKRWPRVRDHLGALLSSGRRFSEKDVVNAGEITDSLAGETDVRALKDQGWPDTFSRLVIPMFEEQRTFKLLLLTKSPNVDNLLTIDQHNQTIVSFSLNAEPVARRWEVAPPPNKRLDAARRVFEHGYETRVRIDPIVPVKGWEAAYTQLVDAIFRSLEPERITLGSLRGLGTTIRMARDKSWASFLAEPSKWGRRVKFELRVETFRHLIDYFENQYGYSRVALCKEPIKVWEALEMDWRQCRCNCTL